MDHNRFDTRARRVFTDLRQSRRAAVATLLGATPQRHDLSTVLANLFEAQLGKSVNRGGAMFCDTIMPDGSIDNSGCDRATACCPSTCQGENCPPNRCRFLLELCGPPWSPCCEGRGECFNGHCVAACATDAECNQRFPESFLQLGSFCHRTA